MTRIDFYVAGDKEAGSREQIACRLVEKAYRLGHRIYVHTDTPEQARLIDDLLWTFQAGSFIPHELNGASAEAAAPVLIGHDGAPHPGWEVLVNLAAGVPTFFSSYARVAEVVDQSETVKAQTREHYRFYRDRGYSIETHNLAGGSNRDE